MSKPFIPTITITRSSMVAAAITGVVTSSFWLQAHPASAACAAPSTSYGTASVTVNVPATGSYRLWSRIMAPDATNNAYMLEVDGSSCFTVGNSAIASGAWTWVDYQNAAAASKITASLTAGNHTVKFIGSEPSVKIDRLLAVTDTACTPTGTGDNCAVTGDTTPPMVAITAPADGASVNGMVNVTAAATDNKGVAKTEFYINNTLQSTVTTAAPTFTWSTTGLANGSYTVLVKAYDAAGNVGTDSNIVTVGNGDTQQPTMPSNVKANATAYNSVSLSWSPSTDNTGVTGYTITRNSIPLAAVDAVTSYTDTTTVPGTSYSYKVSARDAVGNVSAPSAAATVTTPSAPDAQPPTMPVNVQASAVGTSQINVSWSPSTDNTGVTGYDVYRVNGSDAQKVATVQTTQFGDTGLKAGTSYGYYIVARDAKGNTSQQSLTVTAKTADETSVPPTDATTGIVRGKVTGNHRKPLASVRVTLWSGDHRFQSTTNGDGVYRFENIPAGRYRVQYKVSGYQTEEDTIRVYSAKDVVINNVRLTLKDSQRHWWDRWF